LTIPRHAQLQEVADEARASGDFAPAVAALKAAEALSAEARIFAEAADWAGRPKSAQIRHAAGLALAKGSLVAYQRLLADLERAEAEEASAAGAAEREHDDATPDSVLIAAAVDPLAALPRHLAVEALRQLAARLHLPAVYADGTPIRPLDGAQ
jgi:hypothetical protein